MADDASTPQSIVERSVEGQVAVITGGGQGIGRAIALRLAHDGLDIVIADRQGEQAEAVKGLLMSFI